MKAGIDFFPLDVHLDDKWKLIEAEFGLKGFAVVVKLHQKIYGERGYYGEWNDDVALLFSQACGLEGGSAVSEIINSAIKRGVFDSNMYEKYSILTSMGIQKRYFDAVKRRKEITVTSEYLLFDVTHLLKDVNIIRKNVNINCENVYISQQSKVEKSIVKKSKEENTARMRTREGGDYPTLEDVESFVKFRNSPVDARKFYETYANATPPWTDKSGAPIRDWHKVLIAWEDQRRTIYVGETNDEKKGLPLGSVSTVL